MSEVLASVPGWPGLFHLPVSLLRHGVHSNLPNAPQVHLLYFTAFIFVCFSPFFYERFGFTSMQQGKMFFFIGLLMAVLQGGVVRRLPLGSEQKVL